MTPRETIDRATLRAGVLVSLNGLSLWFLAVLVDVYTADAGLPWRSTRGFGRGLVDHTRGWMLDPGLGVLEAVGYLGLALFVAGPAVAVVGRLLVDNLR